MPQPEKPERLMPDVKNELTELADAQDVQVETQKSRFAELERARQKLAEEARDVLKIARENSSDPEKFILEAIEEYAKDEKISLLAAKAKVLQYLSPEWKEKVDAEAKEYFGKFDLNEFVRLPVGSEESTEAIKTLRILCDEGYMLYFVIAVHYHTDPEVKKQTLIKFEGFSRIVKGMLDEAEKKGFGEKENFVLDSGNIFPEAKKYIEEMKKTKTKEEYEYIINLAYRYLILGSATKREFPGFDCDESTLFLQKIAMDEGLEIGSYVRTFNHAVLKLDGLPLVLDTADRKIRTVEECARNDGYGKSFHGSYFWRDSREEYMAQYEDSDHYPRRITGYKRVEKPHLIERGLDMSALLMGSANLLKSSGDIPGAKLHYEKALEIYPNNAEVYNNLAVLLYSYGDVPGAKLHCEKALEIDPNNTEARYGLAILLQSSGDIPGAKLHYEKILEINPNEAKIHSSLAYLFYEQGEMEEARKHLDKFDKLRGGKLEDQYQWLDEELKTKGF